MADISDKFGRRANSRPEEIMCSDGASADAVSFGTVKKVYDFYASDLRRYDMGEIVIDEERARRMRANLGTVGKILRRVEEDGCEEDYEGSAERLERAKILLQEIMQDDDLDGFVVYGRPGRS